MKRLNIYFFFFFHFLHIMKTNSGFFDSPLKKIPSDVKPDESKVLLKSEYTKIGGKKEHKRYLALYDKHILISKVT
jgi:hypothetical protein